ncbi:WG repeat-containing protein [Cohnella silvisoli]|uniref:WG repeat-containing protein n=1 Tax=Cohnella silvisoli TaxID=2873699 RepID=A0ABV1KWK0_9BACL|nr:WG repeat-containing protein [Cohnella silvisoli]MCD9023949.1 WG repeat-containing protein [Cohnella silvisoli]
MTQLAESSEPVATWQSWMRSKKGITIIVSSIIALAIVAGGIWFYLSTKPEKLYYPSGELLYMGELKDRVQSGQGISYSKDGKVIYDGHWINGLYDGTGTLYDNQGAIQFKGEFHNGIPWNGAGIVTASDGSKYEGSIKDGKKNGAGKSYDKSNRVIYDGNWADDQYDGEGTLHKSDGSTDFSGTWKKGQRWEGTSGAIRYEHGDIVNLKPVQVGGKWGYVALDGTWVINPQFEDAREFSEGLAAIAIGSPENSQWGM